VTLSVGVLAEGLNSQPDKPQLLSLSTVQRGVLPCLHYKVSPPRISSSVTKCVSLFGQSPGTCLLSFPACSCLFSSVPAEQDRCRN